MMDKDDIKMVDEWFNNHTEYYGTSHVADEYTISQYDLESFTDFLADNFPDLCCLRCFLGTGDASIWFFKRDLEKAEFY